MDPFCPQKWHLGAPKPPKNDPFWPKMAVGNPGDPKLIEHWLDMIKHHISHPGGSVVTIWNTRKVFLGPNSAQKQPFLAQNCHIWPYAFSATPNGLGISWTWLNIIFHIRGVSYDHLEQCSTMLNQCSSHLWSLGLPMAEYGNFWPKKGHFWGVLGPQNAIFLGLKGPNSPPQIRSTMFNHVQPMFNPFGVAGTAYGPIWPFLAKKVNFGGFWGPPVPFLGGKKGPN